MRHIVIDTETTGMDPAVDRLVEVAAAERLPSGDLVWDQQLCDPGRDIPPESRAIHHIGPDDVAGCPSPAEAIDLVMETIGRQHCGMSTNVVCQVPVMVAHNVAFDRGFLPSLADRTWICTWRCAMHIWPDAPGHGNQVLRYWLGLDVGFPVVGLYPHRALYDVCVTEAILQRMLQMHTSESLVDMSTRPVVLSTVRFGKHKGMKWVDVPRDYLQWCLRQKDMDDDVRHTASSILRG